MGKEGQRIIVNEPQLKSVKTKIIAKFEEFVPDQLKEIFFTGIGQVVKKRIFFFHCNRDVICFCY